MLYGSRKGINNVMNYMFVIHHITKAELFNSFNRNNNRPDEAEDVQHGSDHSLDSDDNLSS